MENKDPFPKSSSSLSEAWVFLGLEESCGWKGSSKVVVPDGSTLPDESSEPESSWSTGKPSSAGSASWLSSSAGKKPRTSLWSCSRSSSDCEVALEVDERSNRSEAARKRGNHEPGLPEEGRMQDNEKIGRNHQLDKKSG